MLQKGSFSFLCEETYESEIIVSSISKGMNALVAILRTENIFPIEPYSTKIAESVMALYDSSEDGSVELFFDDVDLVSDLIPAWYKFVFLSSLFKISKTNLEQLKQRYYKNRHPPNRDNVPEHNTPEGGEGAAPGMSGDLK